MKSRVAATQFERRGNMSESAIPNAVFKDDDPFLLKFLPGVDSTSRELRRDVHTLNTPSNIQLVRFVTVIGATGTGKNHFARVCAGHRQWRKFRESPDAIDIGRTHPDGIGPLELYTDRWASRC